jgi:hypothetical protein
MVAITLLLAALTQDTVDNPEYKGWASFQPGSFVTHLMEQNGTPQNGSQKTTLKSVNETEVVLETEMVVGGAAVGKPVERKVPAKSPAARQGKVLNTGESEIEVGGKKRTCAWKVLGWTAAGKTGTMKVWIADDIPGKAARIEISGSTGGTSTMIASAWEKK